MNKVFAIAALLALGACSNAQNGATGNNAQTAAAADNAQVFNHVADNDVLTNMFRWWNDAYTKADGFTAQSFGQYFTDDAVMQINGKVSAKGLDDLAAHFRQIQHKTQKVKINLPFRAAFTSPDGSKIYTYHTIDAQADGKPSQEMVSGYAEIRDGKIALINFLSVEGAPQSGAR